ncbi:MAG TPA: hypothetical protein VK762_08810 [Polyangiaceae bacterium]|nr:hypothetical protein [Polyangiaceae bacterium]
MRAETARWSFWIAIGRAAIVAVSLALLPGCADLWGFDDLTLGDGGVDATAVAPEAGSAPDAGDAGDAGTVGSDAAASPEGGPACAPPGTILSCGGCNQACDVVQSNGPVCADNATCTYRDCAAGWQNCDKTAPDTNGCESSTTSTASCGACGNVCDTVHSIGATCVASADGGATCQYTGCQSGWADCDPSAPDTDGCETSLSTAANCGACGKACDKANSLGATCTDGTTCTYTGCNAGFADCDTTPPDTNGCETMAASTSCNACGTSCDTSNSNTPTCDTTTGTCKYASCKAGFANCNTTPPDTNGCETNLSTASNCGACGRACDTKTSTGPGCSGSNCTYSGCAAGFADCDTTPPDTNGCESSLSSTATCGACKNAACNTKTGAASCDGTTCSYKCNGGLTDCNAATAPDTDGCECATPGCCSGKCQTTHSNGVGGSFYDCNAGGTFNEFQAQEACEAYAGKGQCSNTSLCCAVGLGGLCLLGSTAMSECGAAQGQCFCWQYSGNAPGTVQVVSGKCTAACGSTSDTPWN